MNAPAELNSTALSIEDFFALVPETTLPNGTVVPSFKVARFAASKGEDGKVIHSDSLKPWANINYHDARKACEDSGFQLITETQWLAIAVNAASVDANWTKGKVGEGKLFRGIRKGLVSEAQPANANSHIKERRQLYLSNGETLWDFNGNIFQWVFDDVQGNADGLVDRPFSENSPSIILAPYPSMEKGMGWYPSAGSNWSGFALIRGGCWRSGGYAGVFRLNYVWPDGDGDGVGFRCTKSL